ncbi:probable pectinesterase/pectinesterase inhibitor 51 [Phtheirospermum japonicum]|uniref:pectinesterase n=1 Tax=Phtheirospermum japonicum TaxID=374723 RepID=A0A830D0H0_9LAMI|nr:probable pectinesterase/pectinesterase inhibitor 51 [Phtheirospermum japonicum]
MMQHRKPLKSPSPPPLTPSSPTANVPKQFQKLKSIFISMASLLSFALLTLLFFTVSTATRRFKPADPYSDNPPNSNYSIIGEVCKASRDPTTCRASLSGPSHVPPNATVWQAIQSALSVSSQNLDAGRGMVQDILDASAASQNRSNAARTCLELLRYSEFRMKSACEALPRGGLKDARAWMSAALVFQYDCWSALKYVNDTSLVDKTMAFFNSSLIRSSSDALAMIVNYDIFGEKMVSWGPVRTERDGFWEPVTGSGLSSSGSVPSGLKANVTVCKEENKCDFKSVQEAVKAGPDNADQRFVIWIKAGVYEETVRVPLEKKNVVFLGDGMGKTVITGSMNVGQQGMTTYNSATVGVIGDGFMASGLTIQNTAGPDAHQAVAFRSDSDLSIVENCEFLGNQDTLYAHSLRQYYKSCRIQGNVDFIFGNSAAFFQDCLILIAPRQLKPEKGENNAVTAHGRIDPAQSTGFVFQNCVINGTDAYMALYYSKPSVHKNFLGRPWKEYSRTVFIHCILEALVMPDGWMPWSGDFALKTLYYGEFDSIGPGSDVEKRVSWSSQIPPAHVSSYSIQNFIQGDQWITSTS